MKIVEKIRNALKSEYPYYDETKNRIYTGCAVINLNDPGQYTKTNIKKSKGVE